MKADDDKTDATPEMEMAAAHSVGAGRQPDTDSSGLGHFLWKRRGKSILEAGAHPAIECDDRRMERSRLAIHRMACAAGEGQRNRYSRERAERKRAVVQRRGSRCRFADR